MNSSTWGPKNVGSPKRNFGKPLGKPTLEGPKGADVLGKARPASKIEGFRGDDLGKLRGFLSVVGLVVGFFCNFFRVFFFFRGRHSVLRMVQGRKKCNM